MALFFGTLFGIIDGDRSFVAGTIPIDGQSFLDAGTSADADDKYYTHIRKCPALQKKRKVHA